MEAKVCIIILNYNNYEDTIECIKSIKNVIPFQMIDIVVVDNNSTNDSVNMIENQFQDIIMIKSNVNKGYAYGNNLGLKYAIENRYRYTCVLNNDTIITENFLEACIIELGKDVAFISPTLMEYSDKECIQSTGGDILIDRGVVTRKNNGMKRNQLPNIIETDYVGGACMFFKTDIIKELGFIPEEYFLFYEETEWCYKAKKLGYRNLCLTNTYIYHKGSVSISKIGGLSDYLMKRNRVVFVKRNINSKGRYYIFISELFLKEILRAVFNKKVSINNIKAYSDGIRDKFSKKYSEIMKDFLITR
jgi:hypothetical protein